MIDGPTGIEQVFEEAILNVDFGEIGGEGFEGGFGEVPGVEVVATLVVDAGDLVAGQFRAEGFEFTKGSGGGIVHSGADQHGELEHGGVGVSGRGGGDGAGEVGQGDRLFGEAVVKLALGFPPIGRGLGGEGTGRSG